MNRNDLPRLLQNYLKRCLPDPFSAVEGLTLSQVGTIRLSPEKPWLPFTAEHKVQATCTEFVWRTHVRMAPLLNVVVEDAVENGVGRLDANLWRVFSMAHARGPLVDQGEI